MGVGLGVNDVPIVGEPVAFGAGFIALLVVCFSTIIGFASGRQDASYAKDQLASAARLLLR